MSNDRFDKMQNSSLEGRLDTYYKSKVLSSEALSRLKAMPGSEIKFTENSDNKESGFFAELFMGKKIFSQPFAVAASVLFLMVALWMVLPSDEISSDALAQLVSKEIALNHNKGLSPEYQSEEYAFLAAQLDKLDFTLANSEKIQSLGLTLQGARYCSIHGQLAAQLKMQAANGERYTLYQTHINDELQDLPADFYETDGVLVEQWQEDGIFFGLARDQIDGG